MTIQMSAERLGEIRQSLDSIGLPCIYSRVAVELLAEFDRLRAENEKYRKGLEFYAGREHMGPDSGGLVEDGEVAREALGGESCSKMD